MQKNTTIPPPPEKPEPNDCCGSGCMPCVFDYYETALEKWQEKYGSQLSDDENNPSDAQERTLDEK